MIHEPRTRRFADPLFALLGVRVIIWLWVVRTLVPAIFSDPFRVAEYHDEHIYFAHEDVARMTITAFKQLPAWNPYYCGGIPGIANPQDTTFAPEFLLKLIFGVGPGRRLAYLLLFVIGMEGMYRLARRLDAGAIGAMLAGAVFGASGFFMDTLHLGWQNFFSFELVPWVALAFLQGLRSWPWRIAGGVIIAIMVLQAGLYTVPYTILMLVALMAMATFELTAIESFRAELPLSARPKDRPEWWTPALTFAVFGAVAAGICAVKLLPMMKVLAEKPRIWEAGEARGLADILSRLTRPGSSDGQPGYVGEFVLALALLGAAFDRNGARMLAMTVLFLTLALGDFADWAPNMLLHRVPVFGQLRFPHRFVIMVALFACVGAAIGVTKVEDLALRAGHAIRASMALRPVGMSADLGTLLVGAIGALIALKLSLYVFEGFQKDSTLDGVFTNDAPLVREAPFRQSRGNRWEAHVWPRASLGSLQCFEEIAFPSSAALHGALPAEEYPLDPNGMTVERVVWTPNQITLRVVASRAGTVVVNQNWHSAWKPSVGRARSHNGLLAVDVPAGEHQLVLRHRDPLLRAGLAISLLSLGGLAFLSFRAARSRLRDLYERWQALPPTPPVR